MYAEIGPPPPEPGRGRVRLFEFNVHNAMDTRTGTVHRRPKVHGPCTPCFDSTSYRKRTRSATRAHAIRGTNIDIIQA